MTGQGLLGEAKPDASFFTALSEKDQGVLNPLFDVKRIHLTIS